MCAGFLYTAVHTFFEMWRATDPPPAPTHAEMTERFHAERISFERLRDMFEQDHPHQSRPSWDIRTDCHSWIEPCTDCGSSGGFAVVGGQSGDACTHPGGCMRWVDEPPTPARLSEIRPFGPARAAEYLRTLNRLGVIQLHALDIAHRNQIQSTNRTIEFVVDMRGMMLSGTTTAIVWAPHEDQRHSSDRPIDHAPGWFTRVHN